MADQAAHLAGALRVESVGGLVEDQQLPRGEHGRRQGEPLAHAQRVHPEPLAPGGEQPDPVERLPDGAPVGPGVILLVGPEDSVEQTILRSRFVATVAEAASVTLLHENEKDIYGDVPARCHDIVTSVDSPNLRLAWDPANFVQVGVRPFTEGYSLLRPHVVYVQIKDALLADASVVVAGAGDGQVVETVRALRDDGFDGFFSLEPHLADYSATGGFSGAELWTSAWRAFTDILNREGIEFA